MAMADIAPITGKRILVTGVTGWVAGPVAASLAAQENTVFGVARFRDAEATARQQGAGLWGACGGPGRAAVPSTTRSQ